ncbi:prealbumin-like fold domain-containing protein [Variovorax sp. ZT4R33]|uniref:prealbumin-like fold domain-containing protein n=1 Tax=Variovorax sp. ZT4R33 TaxID=3443743 RepID=UPI003F45302B
MQRLRTPIPHAFRAAARRLLMAACCLAWPLAVHAQQVLQAATPVSTGVLVGSNSGVGSPTGCTSGGMPTGFPVGMGAREQPANAGNYVGALAAYDVECASFTVTEGAGAATIAFGATSSSGFIGRPTDASYTTTGPFRCPAGQVVSRVGGAHRFFNGGSAGLYPSYIYYACRPVAVVTGDWFNLNLSLGGAVVMLGTATDAATPAPGPISGNIEACAESPTRTCNGIYDTGGGTLIDGFFGSSSNFPNARVSQTISFVNYAWSQSTGDSTQTATWRPSVAGNLFHPSIANNNTLRYQQTYERYVFSGSTYSGGIAPPSGTSTLAYSRTGTCLTARTLGVNEDYTCTNIITGRPDLQVRVTNPASAWTAYGQYQNVTLTAKNFGSAATGSTDNATAVLTLPAGWDAGTLPANCAKAGSPVVVTCQVNPTPLAASSGPGLIDGGQVDFVIPVTPLAGVAAGSYPVVNGARVCVQAATGGNTHVCTVPNDANPFNDDGINTLETATLVVAYQTPPALPPSVATTVVSNGGVGTFGFTSSNGAAPLPASLVTTTPGVGVTAAPSMLTAISTTTFLQQNAPPAGFVLTAISCTGMSAGGTATYSLLLRRVTFNAAATGYGATIACTFTNTRLALTVSKVSNGGVGTFNFTGTNGVAAHAVTTATAGVAVSGAQQSLTTVGAATTVTESAPPGGWRLASISCSGLGAGGTATPTIPGTGTAGGSVLLDAAATVAGSNIACTFTNAKLPTVTVSKVSVGGTGTFAFTGTNGIAAHNVSTVVSGTPVSGVTQILAAAASATNVVESAPPAGFVLTGIGCTGLSAGGSATPNLATRTVALDAAATAVGSDIACTFTNTAVSTLKLVKTSSTPSFVVGLPASYTLTLTNTGVFATQAVTIVTDTVPATLTLGTMPAGCSATGQVVSCGVPAGLPATTGSASFVIPVTPLPSAVPSVSNTATANGGGDPLCVSSGNCTSTVVTPVLAQPSITVRKTTSNGAGSNTFGFVLSGVTNPADSITLTGASSTSSAVVHTGTVGTDATLTESSVPAGWPATPAAVSCLDSATATSGNATTNLATLAGNVATLPGSVMRGGAVITCTFTNTAAPIVALTKSAPATVAPGSTLAYGLSLVNTGAIATGTSVVVREQLPPGVVANSVGLGAGVTAAACGTLPSAAGALLNCTMTITGGIPVGGTRSFTLNATAPLASAGTVLTNYANTNVIGSGTAATAPGAACVSDASVSCTNASTTLVAGVGAMAQSGVRTVTDNQLANGAAQDVLEAVVRDAAQNPVAGAVVTFAATANVAFNGGAVGAAGTCTTNAAGRCQVTATSTVVGLKSSAVSIAAGTVTGAFTDGGDVFHASPVAYTFVLGTPPTVTLSKTTTGGAAGPFSFTLTNTVQASGTATTVAASTPVQVDGNTGTAGLQSFTSNTVNTAVTITEAAVPGWNLASASCTDAGVAVGGLGVGAAARTYTIPAASVQYGKALQCLFTNAASATVTTRKVSVGNVGSFGFTGDNGLAAQSLTTVTAGTGVAGAVQTLTVPGVATTINEDPLPANYALTAVGCTGLGAGGTATPDLPNRKVTLDAAATVAGSAIVCTFTNTYTPPYPKVQIVKTTVGGTGSNVFGFALSGLSAPTDTITVVGASTASGSATLVGTAGLEASIKETVPTGWPANPVSASCVDTASATPTVAFGTLVANQLTIPAANMVAGAAITCTFTNSFGFSVGGRVFNDNGVGAGTANDGLINGSEAGIAGVVVRLTNCAATVLASAVTDGAGRYTLAVPFATAAAAPLCVEETNPATPSAWTSTGASAGGTALLSGTVTTVAGTAYTYTRLGTPDRIAFTWNGGGPASLDFGDVAPNTFATDGAKTGLPGSTVSYPHTFKAQTGGVVRFGIPGEVATPTLAGWSGKVFADTACTGALQAGAVLLYPPSVPVTVVAGQSVCLVMQEFVPATAMNGYSNNATVQASFDFSNAGPALGASYTVHDITTVSDSVLELKKEVRNVTQGGAFGINNQAKSGETLEYRITYTNNGVSPIGTLSVNDTTPSYTSFVGAQAGSTPATLTACQKTTPVNPVPGPTVACATAQAGGGTGALSWHFTGALSPGASGAVMFTVKVD